MIYKIFSENTLIPDEILTQFKSTKRARSYYNSRIALLKCLESINIKATLHDLHIINHHHLEKFPDINVSLSHTDIVGAAAISHKSEYQSIGIDIEYESRIIDPKTQKFFLTSDDKQYISLLELWIKKEAAFKALSNFVNKQTFVLTDIWVKANEFGLVNDNKSLGKLIMNKEEILGQKLLISRALLFK